VGLAPSTGISFKTMTNTTALNIYVNGVYPPTLYQKDKQETGSQSHGNSKKTFSLRHNKNKGTYH
jgi:hypothetical protein